MTGPKPRLPAATHPEKATGDLSFRALNAGDLPLLERWLTVPEVAHWFNEANYIATLRNQLNDARIRQWIVLQDGVPFAYLQDYDIHAWADHPLGFLPIGARGMDTFIGEAALLGKGLATRYLKAHCAALFAEGVPALGIDPHPDNLPARRCYKKVGFVARERKLTQWGDIVCMALFPDCFEGDT